MTTTKTYTDALGRKVDIAFPPQRIISTVPSTTEFLFDLGVGEKVVGRTRYCRYPEDAIQKIPNIGGPKNLHMDKIQKLNPDLILANEEENSREQIEALAQEFPVFVCKVRTLEEALENIWITGEITNQEQRAQEILTQIKSDFTRLQVLSKPLRAAYLIWKEPYVSINRDTFISDMMERCGLNNVFATHTERYPRLTAEELKEADPELVLLSSEPFPFEQKHIPDFQKLLPNARIELVDGEMFAWYESHLLQAVGYFSKLIQKLSHQE
ncbi:MAG: helical backbone metal receptor [Marinifilaceae bacterium]